MSYKILNALVLGLSLVFVSSPLLAEDIPGYSYCFDALDAPQAQCGDVLVWDGVYPNYRYFIIDVPADRQLRLYPDFDPTWGTGNYPRYLADQNGDCYFTDVQPLAWNPDEGEHGVWYLNTDDECLEMDWTRTVYFQFFNAYRITVTCDNCPVDAESSTWGVIKSFYSN